MNHRLFSISFFLRFCVVCLLCMGSAGAWAMSHDSIPVFQGYSGGMMLHAGYQFGKSDAPRCNEWSGATFGIGGALRVNLWNHLRVGAEGYVSTMPTTTTNQANTLAKGSYVRSGWGGVLADACWRAEKVWPYIGASIGGGACKSLYIYDGSQYDWDSETDAAFNRQAFFYVDPYVGVDICLTRRVHLTLKLDWQLAVGRRLADNRHHLLQPTGPRLYFGFLFCH